MKVPVSPEQVFAVLADGWSYVGWVVGASHIREVDAGWPEEGSQIHHSVGPWPLLVHDTTSVRVVDPPRLLELDARLWPLGVARIRLELTEVRPGVTEVRMIEQAVRGPGRLVPKAVQALLLIPRNRESLRRLAAMSTGKAAAAGQLA
jgi:polyketide cyclase/dehydrase/lipid transport protein